LTIGDPIHNGRHNPGPYPAGGALPTGFILDRFQVGSNQIDHIDFGVSDGNSIPPDEGFDLFVFIEFQGQIETGDGLPLRIGLPPIIRDHSTPTAKKDIRHNDLALKILNDKCQNPNDK
jgi:hypothetical protein